MWFWIRRYSILRPLSTSTGQKNNRTCLMSQVPLIDIIIILAYLAGIALLGMYFGIRRKNSRDFMIAGGNMPGWVIGLSIFGTYLSSNTFLGIPGKAFSGNWNSFVFSLAIPFAALIAVKYFIPFYREKGDISAYHHFEKRFGTWAKVYAVICFMLTQLARTGSILFGVGLVLSALLHIHLWPVIVITGIVVIIYTTIGGMEAVIWTDVVQSILLMIGAVLILVMLIIHIPGGIPGLISDGYREGKFSLGSWRPEFSSSTVWVVFLYGFFINLTNFGIDQNYIQRYHAARTPNEASYSVWMLSRLYIPVSLLFFIIGSSLFFFTVNNTGFLAVLFQNIQNLPADLLTQSKAGLYRSLSAEGVGDQILPLFIAHSLPPGFPGLIIAALLAAAQSTISSSMNSAATIYLKDIHHPFIGKPGNDKNDLMILKIATLVFGLISIIAAIAMIGVQSVLDAWWVLSGIFSGGLLGLFLLGWLTRVNNPSAIIAVIIGILCTIWMTIPGILPPGFEWLKSPFHANMIIVIGTLAIFLSGLLISKIESRE
jgi:SSS family solute:Na+ symporter